MQELLVHVPQALHELAQIRATSYRKFSDVVATRIVFCAGALASDDDRVIAPGEDHYDCSSIGAKLFPFDRVLSPLPKAKQIFDHLKPEHSDQRGPSTSSGGPATMRRAPARNVTAAKSSPLLSPHLPAGVGLSAQRSSPTTLLPGARVRAPTPHGATRSSKDQRKFDAERHATAAKAPASSGRPGSSARVRSSSCRRNVVAAAVERANARHVTFHPNTMMFGDNDFRRKTQVLTAKIDLAVEQQDLVLENLIVSLYGLVAERMEALAGEGPTPVAFKGVSTLADGQTVQGGLAVDSDVLQGGQQDRGHQVVQEHDSASKQLQSNFNVRFAAVARLLKLADRVLQILEGNETTQSLVGPGSGALTARQRVYDEAYPRLITAKMSQPGVVMEKFVGEVLRRMDTDLVGRVRMVRPGESPTQAGGGKHYGKLDSKSSDGDGGVFPQILSGNDNEAPSEKETARNEASGNEFFARAPYLDPSDEFAHALNDRSYVTPLLSYRTDLVRFLFGKEERKPRIKLLETIQTHGPFAASSSLQLLRQFAKGRDTLLHEQKALFELRERVLEPMRQLSTQFAEIVVPVVTTEGGVKGPPAKTKRRGSSSGGSSVAPPPRDPAPSQKDAEIHLVSSFWSQMSEKVGTIVDEVTNRLMKDATDFARLHGTRLEFSAAMQADRSPLDKSSSSKGGLFDRMQKTVLPRYVEKDGFTSRDMLIDEVRRRISADTKTVEEMKTFRKKTLWAAAYDAGRQDRILFAVLQDDGASDLVNQASLEARGCRLVSGEDVVTRRLEQTAVVPKPKKQPPAVVIRKKRKGTSQDLGEDSPAFSAGAPSPDLRKDSKDHCSASPSPPSSSTGDPAGTSFSDTQSNAAQSTTSGASTKFSPTGGTRTPSKDSQEHVSGRRSSDTDRPLEGHERPPTTPSLDESMPSLEEGDDLEGLPAEDNDDVRLARRTQVAEELHRERHQQDELAAQLERFTSSRSSGTGRLPSSTASSTLSVLQTLLFVLRQRTADFHDQLLQIDPSLRGCGTNTLIRPLMSFSAVVRSGSVLLPAEEERTFLDSAQSFVEREAQGELQHLLQIFHLLQEREVYLRVDFPELRRTGGWLGRLFGGPGNDELGLPEDLRQSARHLLEKLHPGLEKIVHIVDAELSSTSLSSTSSEERAATRERFFALRTSLRQQREEVRRTTARLVSQTETYIFKHFTPEEQFSLKMKVLAEANAVEKRRRDEELIGFVENVLIGLGLGSLVLFRDAVGKHIKQRASSRFSEDFRGLFFSDTSTLEKIGEANPPVLWSDPGLGYLVLTGSRSQGTGAWNSDCDLQLLLVKTRPTASLAQENRLHPESVAQFLKQKLSEWRGGFSLDLNIKTPPGTRNRQLPESAQLLIKSQENSLEVDLSISWLHKSSLSAAAKEFVPSWKTGGVSPEVAASSWTVPSPAAPYHAQSGPFLSPPVDVAFDRINVQPEQILQVTGTTVDDNYRDKLAIGAYVQVRRDNIIRSVVLRQDPSGSLRFLLLVFKQWAKFWDLVDTPKNKFAGVGITVLFLALLKNMEKNIGGGQQLDTMWSGRGALASLWHRLLVDLDGLVTTTLQEVLARLKTGEDVLG